MTFLSLSWKCYWHSNDLLHVPVDYRAICQHFISLSINLSPASQTFTGMKFKQIQYIALIQLLFALGASGANPLRPREGFLWPVLPVTLTGQEVVVVVRGWGWFPLYRFVIPCVGNFFFFEVESIRPVSQLFTCTLSLGFQAVILGLLVCRKCLVGKGGVGLS